MMLSRAIVALGFVLFLAADLALATSRLAERPTSAASRISSSEACRVGGRFVEATPRRGKVVWVFERVASTLETCPALGARFEIWIWEGRPSRLSGTNVYPTYLHEPAPGTAFELELENRVVVELPKRERFEGWFLAAGDSMRRREP